MAAHSDPTLRLDTAPSLNWLTRRSVTSAIHQSQLTVEPLSINALLELVTPPGQHQHPTTISCALCGKSVLPPSHTPSNAAPPTPNGVSWRPTFFSKQSSSTSIPTKQSQVPLTIHSPSPSVATSASFYPPSSTRLSPPPTPPLPSPPLHLIYVFRLLPSAQSQPQTQSQTTNTIYPLCTTGWCLARLRTTCELWRFVRTGVVDKIWEEEIPTFGAGAGSGVGNGGAHVSSPNGKPPVPPRRRLPSSVNVGVGRLLGMASSALKGAAAPAKQPMEQVVPPPLPKRSEVRRRDTWESVPGNKAEEKFGTERSEPDMLHATRDKEPLTPHPENPQNTKDDVVSRPSLALDTTPTSVQTTTRDPAQIPLPDSPVETALEETIPDVAKTDDKKEENTGTQPEAEEARTKTDENVTADAEAKTPVRAAFPGLGADPPSRTGSPLAPTVSPLSRTGSPAPPPLPRRAARRAPAPVPPVTNATGAADGAGAKSVETDVLKSVEGDASTSVESEPLKSAESVSLKSVESETPKSDAEHESSKSSEPEPKSLEPASLNAVEPESRAGTTTPTIADPMPTKESENTEETEKEETKTESVTETSIEKAESLYSVASSVPLGTSVSHASMPESDAAPLPPPTHPSRPRATSPRRVPPPLPPRTSEDIQQRRSSTFSDRRISNSTPTPNRDEEQEVFIGDTTWEERTWKALVRLREDMFYARLGSVR
ncbi:hypothetical protein K439DRAFT_855389 [Ramaria rubella]|nr:hypothetical protein K439DRAFT_855389 [Ramaria rubella]